MLCRGWESPRSGSGKALMRSCAKPDVEGAYLLMHLGLRLSFHLSSHHNIPRCLFAFFSATAR
eukprot:777096-Pleurochrysis_carterae.AAC.2